MGGRSCPPKEQPGDMNALVESERLLLRRPEEGDQEVMERVFCDPTMMHYLGGPWTAVKVGEALHEWRADWGVDNRWNGTLLRKDTGEAVGTAGLTADTVPGEPGMELSWFVLPGHQRQGLATEITRELLHLAFDGLGAARVVAETHPENPASKRVLEKLAFERLGERQHRYDYLPGFGTQVLWALTRRGWEPHRLPPYSNSVRAMWSAYLGSLGEGPTTTGRTFTAWHFGDNEQDARDLAALVKAGRKRATASAHWAYEAQEPLPAVGDYSVIVDWQGEAQCIIQTTSVAIVPFKQVTARFARTEGEGDRSLGYWRRVHWASFTRELQAIGKCPTEEMPVVCETFEVVFGAEGGSWM